MDFYTRNSSLEKYSNRKNLNVDKQFVRLASFYKQDFAQTRHNAKFRFLFDYGKLSKIHKCFSS